MGTFISLFSPFSLLVWWRDGLGGQWGQRQGVNRGDELPSSSPGAVVETRSLGLSP